MNSSFYLTLPALVLRFPVPGVKQAAAICDDLVALVAGVVRHTLISSLLPLLAPGVIFFIVIVIIVIVIKHLQINGCLPECRFKNILLTCGIAEHNAKAEMTKTVETFMLKNKWFGSILLVWTNYKRIHFDLQSKKRDKQKIPPTPLCCCDSSFACMVLLWTTLNTETWFHFLEALPLNQQTNPDPNLIETSNLFLDYCV